MMGNEFLQTETKEIITRKSQLPFYVQCFGRFGYAVHTVRKDGHNMVIAFERNGFPFSDAEMAALQYTEEKLRMAEIISRKQAGWHSLYFNFFLHIFLFCLQGYILNQLHIANAHPKQMLGVGVILFAMILLVGLAVKIMEYLCWNKSIRQMKEELLLPLDELAKRGNSIGAKADKQMVSVLFTRSHGGIGTLIYWLTGREYTHTSLGLGKQCDTFYSFDYRGFRTEHPAHRKVGFQGKESLCLQFVITQEEYETLHSNMKKYLSAKNKTAYNYTGAVLGTLKIYVPFKRRNHYFCSEFVSENLRNLPSFQLKKKANMYLPTGLAKSLIRQSNLCRVLVNEI